MTRILITGSEGALGFYLKRHLRERNGRTGDEVFCLSRNNSNFSSDRNVKHVTGDFLDDKAMSQLLSSIRPDRVFHLAWETTHGEYWQSEANRRWADASIGFARKFADQGGQYFGFAGTCAEYQWGGELLDEETTPENPVTRYGQEKLRTTKALMEMGKEVKTVFNCGRIFFPFSERENPKRVTSLIVRKLLAGEPLHLRSGDVYRSICHARHVAAAFANMAEAGAGGTFNVVPSQALHLGSFLKLIAQEMGRPELLTWGDWKEEGDAFSEPHYLCGDGVRAEPYFPGDHDVSADVRNFVEESIKRFS